MNKLLILLSLILLVGCADTTMIGGTTILRACNVHHYIDYTAEQGSVGIYLNDSINESYTENLLC